VRERSSATEEHDRDGDDRGPIGHFWPIGRSIEVVSPEEEQVRCDEEHGAGNDRHAA
jgi:hypothetical protein